MELFASLAGIFGLIIGSFLNVIIYRFNTGKGINGRSQCFACSKQLTWRELIPVVSFLKQNGKCKGCKTGISFQYPLIELLTVYAFFFIAFHFRDIFSVSPLSYVLDLVFYFKIASLLIVILAYDFKHKIIPDFFVYYFALIAFIGMFLFQDGIFVIHSVSLLRLLAGPILALPFAALWLVSKGKWIGLGDAKLALGIGFLLGLSQGISVILLAFWSGAIISIFLALIPYFRKVFLGKKHISMKTEIPFAPFLVLGLTLVLFGNIYFTSIMQFLHW